MPIPNEDRLRVMYDSLLPGNPYTMELEDEEDDGPVCAECGNPIDDCEERAAAFEFAKAAVLRMKLPEEK